ncbi:hypothetical protein [Piscirickettsia salmonis]|uniref:hypothetical protein n=1 Tax=Piscirickettsia salmonis TaxID=1238 RepID=UPI0012FEB1EE
MKINGIIGVDAMTMTQKNLDDTFNKMKEVIKKQRQRYAEEFLKAKGKRSWLCTDLATFF